MTVTKKATVAKAPVPAVPSPDEIVSSSALGAYSLIILQLLSRLLTFGLHQIVLRFTNPKTFGIAAVQLELLLATILFLSREGFRCALLRGGGGNDSADGENEVENNHDDGPVRASSQRGAVQKVTNLSYLPIPVGMATTAIACCFYIVSAAEEARDAPFYVISVLLYGVAAFGELLIEPFYIAATNSLLFSLRVRCEGLGVVARCIVTLVLTMLGVPEDGKGENQFGVLAFAAAQFVYALILVVGYVQYFLVQQDPSTLKPRKLVHSRDGRMQTFWFDDHLLSLATTFTKQSLLRHVLNDGDKMLITWLSTAEDQGVYAFVVNYGSLVVRIVFGPLEETGRTLFSKLLAGIEARTEDERKRDRDRDEGSAEALKIAAEILMTLLRFHVLLGLVFACFCTNYTSAVIDLLVGRTWSVESPAPLVLSVYCLYVPVMGVNGITEAFVAAVATEKTLNLLNYWFIAFSMGFMSAGFTFMHVLSLGAIGLVAANAVNLSMRITWSWRFIKQYFTEARGGDPDELLRMLSLRRLIPSPLVWAAFATAWAVTFWSNQHIGWTTLDAKARHIGVGCACALIVGGITFWQERQFIKDAVRLVRGRKKE